MPPADLSRISQLSATIAENTALLDDHLTTHNLPSPSFSQTYHPPNPSTLPADISAALTSLESATLELHDLIRGPRAIIAGGPNDHAARAFIARFDVALHVPIEGSISYENLASKIGVAATAAQTILRLAIAHRIFTEPEPGHVAHSAASRILHDELVWRQFSRANADFLPLVVNLVPALEQFPAADDPTRTAASLAAGTVGEKGFYDLLAENPERAGDFHASMGLFAKGPDLSMEHVLNAFDWASLPNPSLCIDLGGGEGQAAITVARAHQHLRWEVQDLSSAFANLPALPEDLEGRLTYHVHDFFTPQRERSEPSQQPAVYFFRWILHNHPDAYCHRILHALSPSLERNPDAKVVVMDGILPPMNVLPNTAERAIRSMDVTMLELGNGRERGGDAWRKLFADADERFVVERCGMIEGGSRLGAVVVGWRK